jgi:LacI family transcriptional regulator
MIKKVSLKDIAEKVGVSSATVSLVLSGKGKQGRVSKEMSDIIHAVAKEMNYQPNSIARGLRIGRTNTIGLIVADITNVFFSNIAFHIQEYAEKLNYTVIIANTNESVDKMAKLIELFKSHQVDGFIIVPTESSENLIQSLLDDKIPLVLIDRYFLAIETNYISINNYLASYKITKYLISKSCKKIAFVTYNSNLAHFEDRNTGYSDALKHSGLSGSGIIKKIDFYNIKSEMKEIIDDLFSENNNVDAIFFATNTLSITGMQELKSKFDKIPDCLKLACFDKSDIFDFLDYPISYVVQPISEMAKKSVDILVDQIKNDDLSFSKMELYASIVES